MHHISVSCITCSLWDRHTMQRSFETYTASHELYSVTVDCIKYRWLLLRYNVMTHSFAVGLTKDNEDNFDFCCWKIAWWPFDTMSSVIRTHSYCTGQKFMSLTLISQPFNTEMIGLKSIVQSVFLDVSKMFSRRHNFNVCVYLFLHYPPSRYAG